MLEIEFSPLPRGIPPIAFQDAIFKYVRDSEDRPRVVTNTTQPSGAAKRNGGGYLKFPSESAAMDFMDKLLVQPIIFNNEQIKFSQAAPLGNKPTPAQIQKPVVRDVKSAVPQVSKPLVKSSRKSKPEMNLKFKSKSPRDGRQRPQRENVLRLRKLAHRLGELGQNLRLEKLEFGVLRENNFSPEYVRDLIDEGGWFTFEDDEKTIRISIGPTQSNPIVISVAIAIQTIEYVALDASSSTPYIFLELLQNPRFEKGDTTRPSTGNKKDDARRSRTRQSSLDEGDGPHSLVAPFASRWLKITFFQDSSLPDLDRLCLLAGLPIPDLEPELSFEKEMMYSEYNQTKLIRWLTSGHLPWEVAFQCEALYRNGTLVPLEVLALRPAIDAMLASPTRRTYTRDALIAFRSKIEGAGTRKTFNDFEEKDVVQAFKAVLEQFEKTKAAFPQTPTELSAMGEAKFMCHYVKITPTGMYLAGPLSEQSNRVIRHYPGCESNFLRVTFTDESDGRPRFDFEVDTDAFSAARFGSFLKNGFSIGGRHFAFLGYSQSGFRDHGCIFSSDFKFEDKLITPEYIRSNLGEFSERVTECPALYGARMSQAFSATLPSIVLDSRQILHEPDLTFGDFTFSDGCGRISRELAADVWEGLLAHRPDNSERHPLEPIPAVYQIRIGGSKGMVRVDPKLQGKVMYLRPSMEKFQAPKELTLEIARAFETPTQCLLNRPLVMLLSTGGVEAPAFRKILAEALDDAVSGLSTFAGSSQQLRSKRLGRAFRLAETFDKLSNLGLELNQDGIRTATGLDKILNSSLYHIKLGIKHKARIPVPGSYTLVGVCDEDKYLLPRQIYACVQEFDRKNGQISIKYLSGKMLVTRSPVIHPGDAQILYAIGEPPEGSPFAGEGNHLPNCVVFSSLGQRPVPNMLGGGDLDGDIYNLILLPELIPRHIYAPAMYTEKPQRAILDRPSTIDDVADFMVKFICNDAVAIIAINHLVIASSAEQGTRDPNCMVNAELHSRAVDFVKTGVHVESHEIRKPRYDQYIHPETGLGLRPDWQAGHGRDAEDGYYYYACPSVLGELFRDVELPSENPAREQSDQPNEPNRILRHIAQYVARYKDEIEATFHSAGTWVEALFAQYVFELRHICVTHTLSVETSERISEVEVMLGTNLETNTNKGSLIERMKRVTDDLTSFVRSQLRGAEDSDPHDWLARAWKAYTIYSTIGERRFGALSFSWVALNSVLRALQQLDESFFPARPTGITTSTVVLEQTPSDETGVGEAPPDFENWVNWEVVPEPGLRRPRGNHRRSGDGSNQQRRSSGNGGRYGYRGRNGRGSRSGGQSSSRNSHNGSRQTSGSTPRSPASGGSSGGQGGDRGSGRSRGYYRIQSSGN